MGEKNYIAISLLQLDIPVAFAFAHKTFTSPKKII